MAAASSKGRDLGAATADLRADISCVDCANALLYCFGPAHQFDRYYKDGQFDDCKKKFADLSFCFKLKAAGREQTKDMVKQLLAADAASPTLDIVWPARRAPPPPAATT